MYVFMYLCIYLCMYLCVYAFVDACMYVCIFCCESIDKAPEYVILCSVTIFGHDDRLRSRQGGRGVRLKVGKAWHSRAPIYIYVYMCGCVYLFIYVCIYVFMYLCIYVYVYVCMSCIYVNMYVM